MVYVALPIVDSSNRNQEYNVNDRDDSFWSLKDRKKICGDPSDYFLISSQQSV